MVTAAMPLMPIMVRLADYRHDDDARALVSLLDAYARDPAGGGEPLSDFAKTYLPSALAARPQAFSVLAFEGDLPVGLINCIEGFSTFACRPLVKVHDVAVLASHRGNRSALTLYQRCGFAPYQLDPALGDARFLQKKLG